MSKVIVHADDYAISEHVSKSIIEQIKSGAIQSISLIPNMKSTKSGIKMLEPYANQVLVSIHLNLVEGRCVANRESVSMLTDSSGYFKLSWLQIMLKSINKTFREQVRKEFRAQIKETEALLRKAGFTGKLRLDSHQHTHMIPLLFLEVCHLTKEFDVEYIRLTREPIIPFLKTWNKQKTYRMVNLIKNFLLNLFSIPDRWFLSKLRLQYSYFFGLLFTGKMDYERVIRILPLMPKKRDIELVVHAGRMLESEVTKEYNKKDFIKEHLSSRRLLELETVERLNRK